MAGTLAEGSLFAGCRIESVVGKGGMGVVYRATDLALERPVALKVIAPALADDPGFRERFLRESRLAAAIEHPHILPVYAAGEDRGSLFLAMRFVDGEDLRELLERKERLAPEAAVTVLAQVAGALDAAHAKGLVHRDVKPGNVLIAAAGESYLCDFGLTKPVDGDRSLTGSRRFLGTIDYAAPEQIEGGAVDGRADQYALGCVLYECLAGEPPFAASEGMAALWAHMQEPPPSVHATRPELGPAIDGVIARALAKEPDERYATCAEFVEAARGALGVGVSSRLAEAPTRPAVSPQSARTRRRRLSRRGAVAAVVALAAAAAAAVVAVLLVGGGGDAVVVVPNSLVRIDPETNEIVEVVPVGTWPDQVAVVGEYVFTVNVEDGTLSRLDTRSGEVQTFDGGVEHPVGLAAGDGANVWVGSNTAGEVARVDARTLRVQRRISFEARSATWLAAGDGLLWVTHEPAGSRCTQPERTSAIELRTGRARWTVETGTCPSSVAVGEGAAWVVNAAESTVTRVDARTGSTRKFDVGNQAGDVAVAFGSVWVTSDRDDAVWRLNPVTGRPSAIVPVGDLPWEVVADDASVWVSSYGPEPDNVGTLVRVDPATDSVVATIEIGHFPHGVAVTPDGVWVAVAATDFPVAPG